MILNEEILTNVRARRAVLVVSGPSGVGKSTIERELNKRHGINFMTSHTSRDPREGEKDAKHTSEGAYYFISVEEFDGMLKDGDFIEHAYIYDGRGYGLSHDEAVMAVDGFAQAIVVVNTFGARQIKDMFPDVWSVWISPPDKDTLRKRMTDRGDTAVMIDKRLATVEREQKDAILTGYDFNVTNDDLDKCLEQIMQIFQAMQLRL